MSTRIGLVLLVLGCTPAPAPGPAPAPAAAPDRDHDPVRNQHDDPDVEDVEPRPDAETPIADCNAAIAEYLTQRKALDRCARDSDCAEIWPGLCPHGPFYIHREADIEPVRALARRIDAGCLIPECEPPMELGIARCDEGKCVRGRSAPPGDPKPCWDFRETHLEADGAEQGRTVQKIVGTTPQIVIAPAQAGRLTLTVQWPRACTDCKLLVSEHNSGMSRLVDTTPKSTRETTRGRDTMRQDTIELQVTPGPYHMIGTSSAPVDFFVHADLIDAEGKPGRVTRHGDAWTRMCEG